MFACADFCLVPNHISAEIVQYEKELAKKKKKCLDKDSSKLLNEPSSNMKEVLFALKSVLAVHDEPCYALTCTSPICPLGPASSAMPLVGTNLLQEKEDEFLARRPPWQPPLRRIGCQDERLLSEPSLLSSNGGDDLLQSRTTSIQEREDDEDILRHIQAKETRRSSICVQFIFLMVEAQSN